MKKKINFQKKSVENYLSHKYTFPHSTKLRIQSHRACVCNTYLSKLKGVVGRSNLRIITHDRIHVYIVFF